MMGRCGVRGAQLLSSGFTLLETVVVLSIIGLVYGVTGLALTSLKTPRESEWIRELRRARAKAIHTGRPHITADNRAPRTAHILFLPDGRALGPGADPLTGAPLNGSH